ncbi:hypothetical protein [Rhodopirellula sp. MGV]|uniref:hypothetical protein n=1 Tax=Rhodopirellula sp. MGV TaxID=2023130 RepID=UPI0013040918|nr:hypothetical protein [Rhodopirellula sp. MGV]
MRRFQQLFALLLFVLPCDAQDTERILDEVDVERIADEAEDLRLISEFDELEQQVSVAWTPAIAERSGDLEDGLLVPFRIHCDGSLVALWPIPQTYSQEQTCEVAVPYTETFTREVTTVVLVPETRTRTVQVTKHQTETKTRTIPVTKTLEDGTTVTETQTQEYTIQVPYTEEIEETYTVCKPVHQTHEVEFPVTKLKYQSATVRKEGTTFGSQLSTIQPNAFPVLRGDRRAGEWDEFFKEIVLSGEMYVVVFESHEDWLPAWDTVLDPDAYVIILDQITEAPKQLQVESENICNTLGSPILPLPLLGKRSEQPDHQYAFSPYVQAKSFRPNALSRQPVLPSQRLASHNLSCDFAKHDWIYEIQMKATSWSTVEGNAVTDLAIERALAEGDSFIIAPNVPARAAWLDVFFKSTLVYWSAEHSVIASGGEEMNVDQIDLSLAAIDALEQENVDKIIDLVSQVRDFSLLNANFFCQAAFLLHREGRGGMAEAFVSHALSLNPKPLNRKQLIRSQGKSRLWLEETVQDLPLQDGSVARLNQTKLSRMSEIYEQLANASIPTAASQFQTNGESLGPIVLGKREMDAAPQPIPDPDYAAGPQE